MTQYSRKTSAAFSRRCLMSSLAPIAFASILGIHVVGGVVNAQDDAGFGLSELRSQIQANRSSRGSSSIDKGSVAAAGLSLDAKQAQLKDAEAKLLRELAGTAAAADAESSASASARSEPTNLVTSSAKMEEMMAAAPTSRSAARSFVESVADSLGSDEPAVEQRTAATPQAPTNQEVAKAAVALDPFADEQGYEPLPVQQEMPTNSADNELKRTNIDLTRKLGQAEGQLSQLRKELAAVKNRLMFSETEVERLSQIIEQRNKIGMAAAGGVAAAREMPPQRIAERAPRMNQTAPQGRSAPAQAAAPRPAAPAEPPIATVISDKANLRTGPGQDNSPLMSVSRGTRLVVETRRGDWYRVVAPTGDRAWIAKDVLAFSSGNQQARRSAQRVSSAADSAAQELLADGELN